MLYRSLQQNRQLQCGYSMKCYSPCVVPGFIKIKSKVNCQSACIYFKEFTMKIIKSFKHPFEFMKKSMTISNSHVIFITGIFTKLLTPQSMPTFNRFF